MTNLHMQRFVTAYTYDIQYDENDSLMYNVLFSWNAGEGFTILTVRTFLGVGMRRRYIIIVGPF